MQGLGFTVVRSSPSFAEGLMLVRAADTGFGVWGLEFMVYGLWFMVEGLGFRV